MLTKVSLSLTAIYLFFGGDRGSWGYVGMGELGGLGGGLVTGVGVAGYGGGSECKG